MVNADVRIRQCRLTYIKKLLSLDSEWFSTTFPSLHTTKLPMTCIRPATPGFIVTLTATLLLAIVTFCVPFIKSVFFLKASISEDGVSGSIIFGTLGYCLELSNGTTCSKPSVGYELG